jgi:branched-subunit amino acid ABC-type transport system permease component
MNDFLLAVGFGLVTASILAMATVALSLQYGVTNVPNFAHGEFMTIGAYSAYVAQNQVHNVVLEALFATAIGGVAGWLMNRLIMRPFTRAGARPLILFVLTIAVSIILQNAILFYFHGSNVVYTLPPSAPIWVGPFLLTGRDLMTIGGALAVMFLLHLMLRYTKFGKAQRAVSDSPELARVRGIDADRVVEVTWIFAGAIAGLTGFVLAASVGSFGPNLGMQFLLVVFAAAIVGGIGQPYGAMLGALLIGLAMEISALYIASDYKEAVAFGVLILMLLVRPGGLIPTKIRNAVE